MSLKNCLPDLLSEGKITQEQAADAARLFDEVHADALRGADASTAEALASEATIDAIDRQLARKRFLTGKVIKTRARIDADLPRYDGGGAGKGGGGDGAGGGAVGGPIDPRSGAALLDHDPRAPYSNVEARRKAVLGAAHRRMDQVLADHSANVLGQVRKKAQLRDIVRELFSQDSGNAAARELSDAWRQTAEMLRKRFNAAGGDIGYRADWGLPQTHDWKRVRAAGFDAWRAEILPRLDRARMIDDATGRPFTDESLERVLGDVFETIRTNGMSNVTPGNAGARSLANRRGEERFLVFRSADDWMAYGERFGGGDAYRAMTGHIEAMARDIAALEVLGPNPAATLTWIKDSIRQSAALDRSPGSKAIGKANAAAKEIDDLWNEYRGANLDPRNETLALVFSSWRALNTARKLGGAYLSSMSDFAFGQARRSFNGLPQAAAIRDYIKLMRPGSIEDQKLAVRRGLIAEEWASRTAAQSRYLMEEMTGEVPRRLAEGVLRVSLLSRHTQAMRWVYGMETLATYTEAAGKTFDALEPKLRGALQRYGIEASDWDRLRSAKMDVDRGAEWISPHNLTGADADELASKFMEMVHSEVDLAVPVADLGTRAFFHSKLESGTWLGEIGRSAWLFKSFGVSVVLRQAGEIQGMQRAVAARYAGGLLIGTTLMGALALQLKEVGAGRDPRPMNDMPFWDDGKMSWNPGFWGAALLQGGGFGIYGDFLNASQNRFGGGYAQTFAGPLVDDLQGIADVATSKHPERSAVRELKGWVPGGNLWYLRLAFDRMVADQIQEAIDPDYRKSWKRMDRYAREQGTRYFWRPGDAAPDRGPDLSNALAEGPEE